MISLEQARANVGAGVVYQAHAGAEREDGEITSVNDRYVFVRFRGDTGSKACSAEDLELLGGRA